MYLKISKNILLPIIIIAAFFFLYSISFPALKLISGGEEYDAWHRGTYSNKPFSFWFMPAFLLLLTNLTINKMIRNGATRKETLKFKGIVWAFVLVYLVWYAQLHQGPLEYISFLNGAPQ